ncbi:MAG TPA: MarR family transcriptional regulator [Phycisphaerales bacterium]|nr:MarR family transcriptional regulator [Phycisphaerales bacterium]
MTTAADKLIAEAQDRFVTTWGKMGSAWGISRTMAEVHALLYITGEALCTDDFMERLQISRGNASMSLRSLQDWGLIRRVHKRGDRKEYFEAEADVWTMFKTIARERKKREVDPVVASLYEIRDMTSLPSKSNGAKGGGDDRATRERMEFHNQRLDAMLDVINSIDKISRSIVGPEGAGLKLALSLLGKMS